MLFLTNPYQIITVTVTVSVSTKFLLQEITVFLSVRQLAVAVDVGQSCQPLVELGRTLTGQFRGWEGHFDGKYFTKKTSSSRL